MYTRNQLELLRTELKHKIDTSSITDAEVVLLLLMYEKTRRISVSSMIDLLVYLYGREKSLEVLSIVKSVVSDKLMAEILANIPPT